MSNVCLTTKQKKTRAKHWRKNKWIEIQSQTYSYTNSFIVVYFWFQMFSSSSSLSLSLPSTSTSTFSTLNFFFDSSHQRRAYAFLFHLKPLANSKRFTWVCIHFKKSQCCSGDKISFDLLWRKCCRCRCCSFPIFFFLFSRLLGLTAAVAFVFTVFIIYSFSVLWMVFLHPQFIWTCPTVCLLCGDGNGYDGGMSILCVCLCTLLPLYLDFVRFSYK